jgi:murein DD-endopeptidase MepM/ murein hydrolase activator NlpD
MKGPLAVSIAIAVWWLQGPDGAAACELPAVGDPPVLTRKPVSGENVLLASGFGIRHHPLLQQRQMHTGVDWLANVGTPVVAAERGRIASVAVSSELGTLVTVDHGAGWRTLYGHLSRALVAEGECVSAGALVGEVGATGSIPGPRLHFEVQRNGQPTNPLAFFAW